jgi:light-regulated signal transduction histidine kinase (bacteriophytochrome)
MTATTHKVEPLERAYAAPPAPAEDLEQRLRERTEELAAARREIEAVAYSVSHDLRAPLRLIHAHVQMLREDMPSGVGGPDSDLHLDQIQRGARQLSALIDALLTYSRLGEVELKREHVQLGGLVAEVIAGLKPSREVDWRIGELPVVVGDRALLTQALSILLGNALKYASAGRRTRVDIGADAEGVYVRDNGVGFDMRYAGKLFGLFQRLHRQDEFEGVGVGLALARRIIERHGGRIWADANVGEGAIFRFTLAA